MKKGQTFETIPVERVIDHAPVWVRVSNDDVSAKCGRVLPGVRKGCIPSEDRVRGYVRAIGCVIISVV